MLWQWKNFWRWNERSLIRIYNRVDTDQTVCSRYNFEMRKGYTSKLGTPQS
jgi:hypothetical protein